MSIFPYWVQIEIELPGSQTGWLQFDMSLVNRVQAFYETNETGKQELIQIDITYNGSREMFQMAKLGASEFLKAWEQYNQAYERKFEFESPRQEGSIIKVPTQQVAITPARVMR